MGHGGFALQLPRGTSIARIFVANENVRHLLGRSNLRQWLLFQEAGLPIGGPDFNPYVMLEVHYNNPERRTGECQVAGVTRRSTPACLSACLRQQNSTSCCLCIVISLSGWYRTCLKGYHVEITHRIEPLSAAIRNPNNVQRSLVIRLDSSTAVGAQRAAKRIRSLPMNQLWHMLSTCRRPSCCRRTL
jgi:hypothetical protein